MLSIITETRLRICYKPRGLTCAPAHLPGEFHPALPIPQGKWLHLIWRTGMGINSKGFKGYWKNSEAFQREIKIFHSSPLMWHDHTKTHCYPPTEFPEEKAHAEGHLFCFLPAARKGTKQHGLLGKGTSAFSNQDKAPRHWKTPIWI